MLISEIVVRVASYTGLHKCEKLHAVETAAASNTSCILLYFVEETRTPFGCLGLALEEVLEISLQHLSTTPFALLPYWIYLLPNLALSVGITIDYLVQKKRRPKK